jgi:hypothetical protein
MVAPSTSPHVVRRLVTEITELQQAKVYLAKNPQYKDSEDIIATKRNLDFDEYALSLFPDASL